jgi:LuxR family transcriptional regulator, maltose regulon positive regulatory protein
MPSWKKGQLSSSAGTEIFRSHLLRLLDEFVTAPVTLILAPAGSGKSTLLNQWRQCHQAAPVAFLAMNAADAQPVHFFRRWLEGLRHAVPAFDTFSYNQLVADVALPAEAVAESLLHSFAQTGSPLVIVLDDFQHARGTLTEEVFAQLAERLPPHIHLLISSRVQPKLPLSRLQLAGGLRVIDRDELDLTAEEVDGLAERALGRRLDPEDLQHLIGLTEGWLAGIRFALLAHGRNRPTRNAEFSASHPALIDYFAEVVLRELPPFERDLLLCASVTERFCAGLCDTLTGRTDGGLIIENLLARELFIQPLEDRPGWYRFHALFQEFLRGRLHTEQADRVAELHRLAAGWLLVAGDQESALQHAEHSGDYALFISLLAECCDIWSKSGDFPTLQRWVMGLPEDMVLRNSDIGFPLIAALILSRKFNQARYYMDLLQDIPREEISGRFADDSHGPFLDTMLQMFQQETSFRLSADRMALMSTVSRHDMRAFALAILAYHHFLRAEFPAALELAQRARDVLAQLGYVHLESYAELILIQCDRHCGRMLQSVQSANNLFWRHDQRDRHSPSWVNAATAIAVVRYEQNLLDEAQHLCDELVPLVSSACATEVIAAAYLTLVRLLHIRGEAGRANRLMQHLERVLQLGMYDRFVAQLAHENMRQAFVADPSSINRLADQYQLARRLARGVWDHPLGYDESWERYGLAAALWLRSRHQYNDASQLLSRLATVLRRDRVMARLVVVEANQAVLLALQGQRAQALEWLRRIFAEHGPECVNRTVFDEAPGLGELIAEAIQQGVVKVPALYTQMFDALLQQRDDTAGQNPEASGGGIELTQRESEILALLRQGLANQAICEQTGVALSTIKWHLKNIFAKLGVSTRAEAIVFSEQHGSSIRIR